MTSNEMFALDQLPKRILIVGDGYIAAEFAGIMHGLGVETTICHRSNKLLSGFDEDVRAFAAQEMCKKGAAIRFNTPINAIEKTGNGFAAHTDQGHRLESDLILYATGQTPNISGSGLEAIGVELDDAGAIKVNDHYQANIPSIYALGDVTHRFNLTPVATAEAMPLVNGLYTDKPTPVDYDNIPTAVFSQPPIGMMGLTETEARKRYPDIDIYQSVFTPIKHTLSGLDEKTLMKMIVRRSSDRVLGVHMAGPMPEKSSRAWPWRFGPVRQKRFLTRLSAFTPPPRKNLLRCGKQSRRLGLSTQSTNPGSFSTKAFSDRNDR